MINDETIARINELAKKKKTVGLTDAEAHEQKVLREEYIASFRSGMRHHIEGMKVVDPKGNDVTPEKLKKDPERKGSAQ